MYITIKIFTLFAALLANPLLPKKQVLQSMQEPSLPVLVVKKTNDFPIDGKGEHEAWTKTQWVTLNKLDKGGPENATRFKVLYSSKGIYVLFHGVDEKITTTYDTDFSNIFLGDALEVFFHPDPRTPLYFEYEVNQLGKELVLLIPNLKRSLYGWQPWHYEGDRKVKKMVHVQGGEVAPDAPIESWSAELFFPYQLLQPLIEKAPVSGAVWRANFYRLDYDAGKMIKWAWSPVKENFHEYQNYGTIKFE